jgi:preprotein translocase subunit SecB
MKVSPLQPQGIAFEEVSVQCEFDDQGDPISALDFDFQSVKLQCEVGYADHDAPDSMLVSLRLRIPNTDGKKAPYRVNIAVTGLFKWLKKDNPREQRRDLTVVNGATILYGSIREMTLNITSRSASGPMLLPAVNFEDNRPSLTEQQTAKQGTLELAKDEPPRE